MRDIAQAIFLPAVVLWKVPGQKYIPCQWRLLIALRRSRKSRDSVEILNGIIRWQRKERRRPLCPLHIRKAVRCFAHSWVFRRTGDDNYCRSIGTEKRSRA